MLEPPFRQLASQVRRADSFLTIASAVIRELEEVGWRGIVLVAHDENGAPSVWASTAHTDRARALDYLAVGCRSDPALAVVRSSHAPARSDDHAWVVPILGCGELIGTVRLVANDDRDRTAELSLLGSLISVRLALLGIEAPLAAHVQRGLTHRQHEVAYLVARGCTNPEIGRMLSISHNAVKKHVSRVLAVLDLSNRTELAAVAGRWSADRPAATTVVLVERDDQSRSMVSSRITRAA